MNGSSRNSKFALVAGLLLLLLVFAGFPGCGESTGQQEVSGKVTVNGEPLSAGAIRFQASSGIASGTTIQNGKFHIPQQRGPTAGLFQVFITSYRSTGRQKPDPNNPAVMIDDLQQFIPPKYNSASTLTAEVTVAGENYFEFELSVP